MTRKEAKEKLYLEWQKFLENNIDYAGISEAYKMAIEALEQEPCEDAVSRQTVKEQMIKYGFHAPDMTVTEFVEDLLPVTPSRPKGYWIEEDLFDGFTKFTCSECGDEHRCLFNNIPYNFCSNCGADMRDNKKEVEYMVMIKEKPQRNYRLYRVLNNKQDAEDLCSVLQSDNISAKINKRKITKKKEQE